MPRGRPRKNPATPLPLIDADIEIEESVETVEATETIPTKKDRKTTSKEYPICAFCKREIRNENPREIKFNQLAGTGEYMFRAINTKPGLCGDCWKRTVRALDNWLIKNGIPEKFTNGRGHRETDE